MGGPPKTSNGDPGANLARKSPSPPRVSPPLGVRGNIDHHAAGGGEGAPQRPPRWRGAGGGGEQPGGGGSGPRGGAGPRMAPGEKRRIPPHPSRGPGGCVPAPGRGFLLTRGPGKQGAPQDGGPNHGETLIPPQGGGLDLPAGLPGPPGQRFPIPHLPRQVSLPRFCLGFFWPGTRGRALPPFSGGGGAAGPAKPDGGEKCKPSGFPGGPFWERPKLPPGGPSGKGRSGAHPGRAPGPYPRAPGALFGSRCPRPRGERGLGWCGWGDEGVSGALA